jgi:uncharacterized protein
MKYSRQDRTWAMMCHLSALIAYIFPFGNLIVTLTLWLIKREDSPFVDDQGKEALNFQLSLMLYFMGAAIINMIFLGLGFASHRMIMPMMGLSLIGLPLFAAIIVFAFAMIMVAVIKTNSGEKFRYPFIIRFIK